MTDAMYTKPLVYLMNALTLWYLSCISLWAASELLPIAFASYWVNVPERSVWYLEQNEQMEHLFA